jgi:hypothetical protein
MGRSHHRGTWFRRSAIGVDRGSDSCRCSARRTFGVTYRVTTIRIHGYLGKQISIDLTAREASMRRTPIRGRGGFNARCGNDSPTGRPGPRACRCPSSNLVDMDCRTDRAHWHAVSGLAAKPVIDMMGGVHTLEDLRPVREAAAEVGYCYAPYQVELEHWFCKPSPGFRTHHLHLIPVGSPQWIRPFVFRDYLRAHADIASEYGALKWRLAQEHRL